MLGLGLGIAFLRGSPDPLALILGAVPGATVLWPSPQYWFQDNAGAVPVTAEGQRIRCWIARDGKRWVQTGADSAAPTAAKFPNGEWGALLTGAQWLVSQAAVDLSGQTQAALFIGARKTSTAEKVAEIRRWHVANGWRDIGYHWILDRDGTTLAGRPETVIGSLTIGRNTGTIGICLIGGHGSAETDRFSDHFTRQQDINLRQMIDAISLGTVIRKVSGHNEYAAKGCPGFDVATWLKGA